MPKILSTYPNPDKPEKYQPACGLAGVQVSIFFSILAIASFDHYEPFSMKKQTQTTDKTNKLCQNAEYFLNKEKKKDLKGDFSETKHLKLIHELEVHRIELEMQNEELKLAKEKAELAEKKYTELYDWAPSGLLSLTETGEITDLNFSAVRLLGKEYDELIKSSFGFYVSSDTRADFNTFLQKIYYSKIKQTCELKLAVAHNTIKYVLVNGITSKIDKKCLISLADISKHKYLEGELIKAREKAEENDRLKSAFLANMSHEIRTPMNGILGFTDLLKNMKLNVESQREYLGIIEKSGIRMLNILNDIISISKIESHQMEISISDTNVNEQLEYIYHFFKMEAKQKKIDISIKKTLPKNEEFIRTDREKVYGVLTNLVKNAIKFTQEGYIELGCERKDEFLEFCVKNSGSDIRDELKDSIFERFRQGSDPLKLNVEGAGLGLSISKAYVELLGGKIWVESGHGQGTTFRFTLPFLKVMEKIKYPHVIIEEEVKPNPDLKILIVDDDETTRMLLSLMLRPLGSEIFEATTGQEAIDVCRQNPGIKLALMDVNMPGITGYQATRQIREFNKEIIIIAQTAFALHDDREKAIVAGCDNYISKPLKRAALLDLIRKYLN